MKIQIFMYINAKKAIPDSSRTRGISPGKSPAPPPPNIWTPPAPLTKSLCACVKNVFVCVCVCVCVFVCVFVGESPHGCVRACVRAGGRGGREPQGIAALMTPKIIHTHRHTHRQTDTHTQTQTSKHTHTQNKSNNKNKNKNYPIASRRLLRQPMRYALFLFPIK
jgi:hypothetical protein